MSDDDITISTVCSFFFLCSFIACLRKTSKNQEIGSALFRNITQCLTIAGFRVTLTTSTSNKSECMLWVASCRRRCRPLLLPEFLELAFDAFLLSVRLAYTLTLSKMK